MNFVLAFLIALPALPLAEDCEILGCDPALLEIEPVEEAWLAKPPAEPRIGGKIALGVGLGMVAAGLVGFFATPDCATWDGRGRCSAIGEPPLWSSISFFLGLGLSVSSYAWIRQDAAD